MAIEPGKLLELYGREVALVNDLTALVREQRCPFIGGEGKCHKTRKGPGKITIGTCSIRDEQAGGVMICPSRMLDPEGRIFRDCLPLLRRKAGDRVYAVPEVQVPGGKVDYLLTSLAPDGQVRDFVGVEVQTLDTTSSIWPTRQRYLYEHGVPDVKPEEFKNEGSPSLNWKMTQKTILVQLLHKIETFDKLGKRLVLVLQDVLFSRMCHDFNFDHVQEIVSDADEHPMRFHLYGFDPGFEEWVIRPAGRYGTDVPGVAACLLPNKRMKVEPQKIDQAIKGTIRRREEVKPLGSGEFAPAIEDEDAGEP